MFALLFLSESRGARVKRETISWEILSYTFVPSSPLQFCLLLAELSLHKERSGGASSRLPEPENWCFRPHSPPHLVFVPESLTKSQSHGFLNFFFFCHKMWLKFPGPLFSVRSVAWSTEEHRRILTLRPVHSLALL